MDFSEQYRIKGEARDVRCVEKHISNKQTKKQKTIVYLLWICQGQYDVNIASC